MDYNNIITVLITTIGAGGIGAFLTYKLGNRKQNQSDFSGVVQEYKDLVETYKKDVADLSKKVDLLIIDLREKEKEITELRHQLLIFESSHVDIPLAMWMKDTNGKMIFLNSHYEDIFLLPRGFRMSDYIGKDDYSVWSAEIAKGFIRNDKQVMFSKKHIRKIEEIEDGEGVVYYAEILKYPRKLNNSVIGISGIILRTAKTKDELK